MKKNRTRSILAFGALALTAVLGGCAHDIGVEPTPAKTQSIVGNWDYRATDGMDLSGYDIHYTFDKDTWLYSLGEAGMKSYSYTLYDGGKFKAALHENTLGTKEPLGSVIEGDYRISNDSLTMKYGGHTALLVRVSDSRF